MLPIQTSIQPRRTPLMNYALIAINCALFLASYWPHRTPFGIEPLREWAQPFMLFPERPYLWQFVSYAFLHGSFAHIFGNMFFLYIFGNNVNDRLGHIGYLCFYLAGAVFAGLGHAVLHTNPVLGASGAVAAVTGAYLVLFPHTYITVLYFFYVVGTFEIKAIYLILIKLIFIDNVLQKHLSTANIAFDAHLAGYAFGILVAMVLLAVRLLDSDYEDLWGTLRLWLRRRFGMLAPSGSAEPRKPVDAKVVNSGQENLVFELRTKIADALAVRDMSLAGRLYRQLVGLDAKQVLPRQHQLDLANFLMSDGQWELSAQAYQRFLSAYENYEYIEQIYLMLGLIYGRYLNNPAAALQYLRQARGRLRDQNQIALCEQEISRLENR